MHVQKMGPLLIPDLLRSSPRKKMLHVPYSDIC
jgi:hypothetical protein